MAERLPALVASLTLLGSIALPTSAASAYDLRLRSWGLNTSGQLGDGTKTQRLTPTSVVGLSGAELNSVAAGGTGGSAGSGFGLTLLANGTVESWGLNDKGQLGNGTTTDSSTPVTTLTALTGVDKIAAPVGGDFSLVPSVLKRGVAYTLACRSLRWDGRRCRMSSETSAPSRCAWKNRTFCSTRGAISSRAGATLKRGEVPLTVPVRARW
ncbi:RCC1 domain-containing protein [Kitasatospora sp. NPDC096128]|uniref:RCC1 domain-containing protein n=1 Tax=Kitasatospora sp. NPDC096128 TaxID=3155547 RepID=UPI0033330672